jgi:phosphoglucosamine mutase
MASEEIFGTDGIRGQATQGWLTPQGATLVGRAAGMVLGGKGAQALLAHDGRESGRWLEAALAEGLSQAGVSSRSAGLLPTPGLAWLVRKENAALGIMVSASHNPSQDNGIKIFGRDGDKLSDEVQGRIEDLLRSGDTLTDAAQDNRLLVPELELESSYERYLIEELGAGLNLEQAKIVLDCANGAGSKVGPRVLTKVGAQVIPLAHNPDGKNINQDCGSTHPEALMRTVQAEGALLGIALDGDGDRCMLVDEHGTLVDGDGILTILGRHGAKQGSLPQNKLAATVMSNRALHIALEEVGVSVIETTVGDRAVVEAMRREGLALGGEQSGHVVLGERTAFIGDGLATALAVLEVLSQTGESLSSLASAYQRLPQVLLNVTVGSKPDLSRNPRIMEKVAEAEEALGSHGRVLLRYSGTEPLARVMVEGPDAELIQRLAQNMADCLVHEIGPGK